MIQKFPFLGTDFFSRFSCIRQSSSSIVAPFPILVKQDGSTPVTRRTRTVRTIGGAALFKSFEIRATYGSASK